MNQNPYNPYAQQQPMYPGQAAPQTQYAPQPQQPQYAPPQQAYGDPLAFLNGLGQAEDLNNNPLVPVGFASQITIDAFRLTGVKPDGTPIPESDAGPGFAVDFTHEGFSLTARISGFKGKSFSRALGELRTFLIATCGEFGVTAAWRGEGLEQLTGQPLRPGQDCWIELARACKERGILVGRRVGLQTTQWVADLNKTPQKRNPTTGEPFKRTNNHWTRVA